MSPTTTSHAAHRYVGGRWADVGVWAEEHGARMPPFEEVPLDVTDWWPEESP